MAIALLKERIRIAGLQNTFAMFSQLMNVSRSCRARENQVCSNKLGKDVTDSGNELFMNEL
jgi:hypothetical protein